MTKVLGDVVMIVKTIMLEVSIPTADYMLIYL